MPAGNRMCCKPMFIPRVAMRKGETIIEGCEGVPRAYRFAPEEHRLGAGG